MNFNNKENLNVIQAMVSGKKEKDTKNGSCTKNIFYPDFYIVTVVMASFLVVKSVKLS